MCRNSWAFQDMVLSRAFDRSNVRPGALHSISPRICRMAKLESPYTTRLLRSNFPKKKHNNRSSYSASFTVYSDKYREAAATTVHPGSFHTIALQAPPPRFHSGGLVKTDSVKNLLGLDREVNHLDSLACMLLGVIEDRRNPQRYTSRQCPHHLIFALFTLDHLHVH